MRWSQQASGLSKMNQAACIPLRPKNFRHTRTLAVTSGKGGVGKTQIAANIAVGLAQMEQRVLLLDADLGLASLDLTLGVSPRFDLRHYLDGEKTLDEIRTPCAGGVDLLSACPGRYEMANMAAPERATILRALEEIATQYDVVVIDTGAGIGSNSVAFAASADEVLLVSTPDPTAMRDAYAMAKVLHRRAGVEHIRFIANQVKSPMEGFVIHERLKEIVERFLSLEFSLLGMVPRDETVQRAVREGSPYVLDAPECEAAKATLGIVRTIYHDTIEFDEPATGGFGGV